MSSSKTPSNNPFDALPQEDEANACTLRISQQQEHADMMQVTQDEDDAQRLRVHTLQRALPPIPPIQPEPRDDNPLKRGAKSPPPAPRPRFSFNALTR